MTDIVRHLSITLRPDASRTVIRPFSPSDPAGFAVPSHPRAQRIVDRLLKLDERWLHLGLERTTAILGERHRDMETILIRRFHEMEGLWREQTDFAKTRETRTDDESLTALTMQVARIQEIARLAAALADSAGDTAARTTDLLTRARSRQGNEG